MLMYNKIGLICALFGWANSMGADTLKTVSMLPAGFKEDSINLTNFDFLQNGLGRVFSDDIVRLNKSKQNINSQCWNQFYEIIVASQNRELLALKFLDSWGKIPSGIMWGHLVELGNFDECLSINNQLNMNADVLQGQYCMANIPLGIVLNTPSQLTQMAHLKVGICIPRSCDALAANTIINQTLSRILKVPITSDIITQDKCIKSSNKPMETIDWIAIIVFFLIAIIILYSTIYDWFAKKRGSIPRQELVAFSLFVNCRILFKTSSRKSSNIVSCLNGIRCLSIIWIVFGHSYMMSLLLPNVNTIEILEWAQTPFSMFLQSGTISVDSFFFLSGFLLVWAGLKEMEKNKGKLNVPLMYIHRYIRLTPVVAATMLFFVSLYRHMGNGPLWNGFTSTYTLCYDTWWATLLYVQNYAAAGKMCLGHTWYLAIDMQLYIISPLILIPLYKWKKISIAAIIICTLLLVACLFTTIVINGFSVFNTTGNLGADTAEMRKIYYSTHIRASPWLIGIIFGYFLYQKRNSRIIMSKKVVIGGWLLSLAMLATGIFALYPKTLPGAKPLTVIEGAFYLSLSRVAWPLALSWIVFACVNGYGGFANTILSLTFWQPMARLSYCMYITHLVVETIHGGRTKVNVHFSDYDVILRFWGDFGITILVSIVTFLMFESPVIGIEKALFGHKKTKTATKEGISNQTFYQNES